FAHAVHAAAPADGSQTGDAPSQGNRRDDGTQNSTARAGADAPASSGAGTGTGGGGTGRHRDGQDGRPERILAQPRTAGRDEGKAMGGIFA
ncbi:MAG: hypothetical protein PHE36_09515, partial [Novosphingobium sp.]|nr:hypothetical protein [Novosphingobium sp.]